MQETVLVQLKATKQIHRILYHLLLDMLCMRDEAPLDERLTLQ